MVAFKCKMCGGDLNIAPDATVCVCEFCDTQQTVPTVDNQKKANLFNRANCLRMSSDFDAAATVYQNIVAEFPDEAEAYWGLCLCKYGIEYVDDTLTGHKIPTCHRTHFESIHDDQNYKQACDLADSIAKEVFLKEADAIDQLQKDILSIVDSEKPYDVFICYKESDADGSRTEDSVLAQEIYDALSDMNYRIFLSRISLEDKLGREYEPYIYAALHSARVMLVVGTCYEYFDAAWVKNEWKRFLDMAKTDKRKVLIPCYKGIEPEDIPPEMRRLQAQDMSKLGFMQDLVRGIKKIIGSKQDESSSLSHTIPKDTPEEMLMRHARVSLADKDWERAQEYINEILEVNPEYAPAYIGRLMVEMKVSKEENLGLLLYPLRIDYSHSDDWKRAIRYATPQQRKEYEDYVKPNSEQSERMQYLRASKLLELASTKNAFIEAEQIFQRIIHYSDSKQMIDRCRDKQNTVKSANEAELKHLEVLRTIYTNASGLITSFNGNLYGLSVDGRIFTTKPFNRDESREGIRTWHKKGVVAISSSYTHAVGLKSDGTVIATGDSSYGKCDVSAWKDIVAITAGKNETVGLKSDGTVVAVGWKNSCYHDWRNIAQISSSDDYTVGIKHDGTIVIAGDIDEEIKNEISSWTDIVDVKFGKDGEVIGLKTDGTVITAGCNEDDRCFLSTWTGIVAIYVSDRYTIGLRIDGFYVTGSSASLIYDSVRTWDPAIAIVFDSHSYNIYGLRENGTILATDELGRYETEGWKLFEDWCDIKNQQLEHIRLSEEKEAGWQRELIKAETHLKTLIERKEQAERERNSLNVFQFKRKEELRKEIYQLLLAIDEAKEDIRSIQDYGYIYLDKDEYR